MINDDDKALLVSQYMPNVSVAPNGRVDVAWGDTRDDVGGRVNDVYYASSTDNGDSFGKNVRMTDRSIDRHHGVFISNFAMSAPPVIASTNAYAIVGWDDTRLTDPTFADNASFGGGLKDITATVQYEAVGGGTPKAVKLALAVSSACSSSVLFCLGPAWLAGSVRGCRCRRRRPSAAVNRSEPAERAARLSRRVLEALDGGRHGARRQRAVEEVALGLTPGS